MSVNQYSSSSTYTRIKVRKGGRTISIFHDSIGTFAHRWERGILLPHHLPLTPTPRTSCFSGQEARSPGATSFVADVEGTATYCYGIKTDISLLSSNSIVVRFRDVLGKKVCAAVLSESAPSFFLFRETRRTLFVQLSYRQVQNNETERGK